MTGFVFYVLLAAYKGLAARPSAKVENSTILPEKKSSRVAVSILTKDSRYEIDLVTRSMLCSTVDLEPSYALSSQAFGQRRRCFS